MLRYLSLLIVTSCTFETPDSLLGQCTWVETTLANAEPSAKGCWLIAAPEHGFLSLEPIDPCDAPRLGLKRLYIRELVPWYGYQDMGPEGWGAVFRKNEVACPVSADGPPSESP